MNAARIRLSSRLVTILALLVAAAPAGADDAPRWQGPLSVRSQFLFDQPTLDLTPADARTLAKGTWRIEVQVVLSSTFERTGAIDARREAFAGADFAPGWDFILDGETLRPLVRADFGVARRLELGIEVPLARHSGGFLDSIIDSFHDAFGLPSNDRETQPRDQFLVDLIAGDGRLHEARGGSGLGDVVLRAKLALVTAENWALSARYEAKAPTGTRRALIGSGEWDHGLGLLFSGGSGRHVVHAGLARHRLGQPDHFPVEIRDRTAAYFGLEHLLNERWSIAWHLAGATSILPEAAGRKNDRERLELVVGFRYRRQGWSMTAGVLENVTTNDNAADVGAFVAFAWTN